MQHDIPVMKAWSEQIHWTPRLQLAGRVAAHGFYSRCQSSEWSWCDSNITHSAVWNLAQCLQLSYAEGSKSQKAS